MITKWMRNQIDGMPIYHYFHGLAVQTDIDEQYIWLSKISKGRPPTFIEASFNPPLGWVLA